MRSIKLLFIFIISAFPAISQVADFSASTTTICVGGSVQFENLSTGAGSYNWTFLDGGSNQNSTTVDPLITYPTAGVFTVILTASSGPLSSDTEVKLGYITVLPAATATLTSGLGTDNQALCVGSPLVDITYTLAGASNATFTGLPIGVSGSHVPNADGAVITIAGTPSAVGVYNYSFTTNSVNSCAPITVNGTITVDAPPTISLTSGQASQIVCINTAIAPIQYTIGGSATSATATGLPAGVSFSFVGGVLTISGTPTVSGSFPFTVSTLGGACPPASLSGVLDVSPPATAVLTSSVGTDNQTICLGGTIVNITYDVTEASGATFSGLPAGVVGSVVANATGSVVTIAGTPTASGIYNYSFTTTLTSCLPITVNGTITVELTPTINLTSGSNSQTVCDNNAITPIEYTIGGSATSATVSGLPAGVSFTFSAGIVTISGTPTTAGSYTYTVTTSGGVCPPVSITGVIEVTTAIFPTLSSSAGTDAQIICLGDSLVDITYDLPGASGATFSGLPTGVIGTFITNSTGGTVSITGLPVTSGVFNYSFVSALNPCLPTTVNGIITVETSPAITLTAGSSSQIVCVNTAIDTTVFTIGGTATTGSVSGLPAGVNYTFSAGVVTITGSPIITGTYPFTVTASGGVCPPATLNGTIYVEPDIQLISGPGTDNQIACQGNMILDIVYSLGVSITGATVDTLPAGIFGVYTPGFFTISGSSSVIGTVAYTITTTGGFCGSATASGTITVEAGPTINLTSAPGTGYQTVCTGSSIIDIEYTIGGSATGGFVTGLPTGINGVYNFGVLTISGSSTDIGTFPFSVSTTGSACGPATAFGEIVIDTFPVITMLSAPLSDTQHLCLNSEIDSIVYILSGSAVSAFAINLPAGLNVTILSDSAVISGSATSPGVYNYSIVTIGGACVADTAYGMITIDDSSGVQLISPVGTDNQVLCNGATTIDTIQYVLSLGADTAVVTNLPLGITAVMTGDTLTITGTPGSTGTYFYNIVVSGGFCPNDTIIGSIDVQTSMISLVSAPYSNDQLICINTSLDSIVYEVGGPITVMDLPPGVTATYIPGTPNLLAITGTPTDSGSYYYTMQFSGPCGTSLAVGYITVSGGISNFIAGPDTTINLGQNVDLFAVGDNIQSYVWAPAETISNAIIFNPVATPSVTTTYTVSAVDNYGCIGTLPVTITVNTDIELFIPNLFSPNGDGFNDTWEIPNLSLFPNTSVNVINREGQVVYENANYDNTWDGTFNGKKLPDATYYYLVQFTSTDQVLKGAVTILRNEK
ncbi:MAG: gliding motility-associated C-terminal domain-containing protein [Crocinitomicaceae bacterium]